MVINEKISATNCGIFHSETNEMPEVKHQVVESITICCSNTALDIPALHAYLASDHNLPIKFRLL
jgi:hypothetical protein